MTNDDAAALAAYRSDPVQARYQSWETPYPLDSARALIAQMRTCDSPNPAYGSRSASRPADGSSATSRSASMATRPARPPSGSPSPLTRKATGTPPKHYAQTNQPTSGAPVSPFLAWMCSHEERPDFLPESFYVVVVPWFGRPAK
jgi:hypothetical protein